MSSVPIIMEEISTTFRRGRLPVEASQPYAAEMTSMMNKLAAASTLEHDMLREREDGNVAAILVVTSDRGMCGGYNNNVFMKAAQLQALLESKGYEVVRYVTGNKGIGHYKFREDEVVGSWGGFSQDPTWETTHDVRRHLIDGFIAGSHGTTKDRDGLHSQGEGKGVRGFDQVHVVYTEFESMLTQTARAQQLLPVEPVIQDEEYHLGDSALTDSESADDVAAGFELEPYADSLMEALLPQYVSRILFAATIVLVTGVFDDTRDLSAKLKLIIQIICAGIVVYTRPKSTRSWRTR